MWSSKNMVASQVGTVCTTSFIWQWQYRQQETATILKHCVVEQPLCGGSNPGAFTQRMLYFVAAGMVASSSWCMLHAMRCQEEPCLTSSDCFKWEASSQTAVTFDEMPACGAHLSQVL